MSGAPHPSRGTGGALLALLVGIGVLLAYTAPAGAQDGRGLRFVGGLAYESGGPGPSLVDALAAADLGDDKPGRCYAITCVSSTEYPFYFNDGLNVSAVAGTRYRFDAPFSVELLLSNGQRGHAEGYNDQDKQTLLVAYASFMLTATAGVHVGPLRLSAGPVVNNVIWDVKRNTQDIGKQGIPTVGVTLGAGGSIRIRDVLVSLRAGARRFPTTDLHPTFNVPLQADYRSFFVGIAVLPAAG